MRIEKRSYEVYSFDELSEGAKTKALEHFRDINVEYDGWHDPIIEGAQEDLKAMGYEDAKIFYSGFWSQGDGAIFTANVDITQWMKSQAKAVKKQYAELEPIMHLLSVGITQSGRYSHEMTMQCEVNTDAADDLNELDRILCNKLEDAILEDARSEARRIYKNLQTYYEELTSDDQVIEAIKANDYEFEKNGKFFTL